MRRFSPATKRWYVQQRGRDGRFLPKGVRGRQPILPNGGRAVSSRTTQTPEERSLALLRALVPPKDFHEIKAGERVTDACGCCTTTLGTKWVEVIGGDTGARYRIYFPPRANYPGLQVQSYNIKKMDGYGNIQSQYCGYPVPIDPSYIKRYESNSSKKNPVFTFDDGTKDPYAMYAYKNYTSRPKQIPYVDQIIGQYLGLKYNERDFLARCYG
jgi:uncharacterized protein (UPF0297 family)